MVSRNAMKIVKTENGTNASIIVTDGGNGTQPMRTTTTTTTMAMTDTKAMATMSTALSTSLGDLSDQENGTTGKCEKPS